MAHISKSWDPPCPKMLPPGCHYLGLRTGAPEHYCGMSHFVVNSDLVCCLEKARTLHLRRSNFVLVLRLPRIKLISADCL